MDVPVRIPTGVKGFDEIIEGGLLPGKTYLLTGPPGSGKTTFSMHFLLEGARKGENTAYFSLIHDPLEAVKDMARFDPSVWSYVKSGKIFLQDYGKTLWKVAGKPPTWGSVLMSIREIAASQRVSRLVVDPITAIDFSNTNPAEKRAQLANFIRTIEEMGVTAILVAELTDLDKYTEEYYLAEGVIMLHYFMDDTVGDMVRGVQVLKMRRTRHETRIFPLKFTDRGLVVTQ
ncbi:RAD55 family ATPase [Thermococcus waiotapuensis]|uniref:RAD55 family ATPase n=1 Tax=Thermococcus waiotapuensis TaxID=90909 RepID=A0AAE4T4A9_9EURY|nr:RAD55 family ATPase [Thermococcus waiotapuensis]MDV3104708.1 RAD55 family ATPase [Thermococcus waiotapuensis]